MRTCSSHFPLTFFFLYSSASFEQRISIMKKKNPPPKNVTHTCAYRAPHWRIVCCIVNCFFSLNTGLWGMPVPVARSQLLPHSTVFSNRGAEKSEKACVARTAEVTPSILWGWRGVNLKHWAEAERSFCEVSPVFPILPTWTLLPWRCKL